SPICLSITREIAVPLICYTQICNYDINSATLGTVGSRAFPDSSIDSRRQISCVRLLIRGHCTNYVSSFVLDLPFFAAFLARPGCHGRPSEQILIKPCLGSYRGPNVEVDVRRLAPSLLGQRTH